MTTSSALLQDAGVATPARRKLRRRVELIGEARGHVIALDPTPEQEDYFRRAAGTARFAYNWG